MIIGIVFGGKGIEKQSGLEACQDIEKVLHRFRIKSKRICLNKDLHLENLKRVGLFFIIDSNCEDYSKRNSLFNHIEAGKIDFIGQDDKTFKLARNKFLSNKIFCKNGIKTPKSMLIDSIGALEKIKRLFGNKFPLIVKDNFGSSSENVKICFDEKDLKKKAELLLKKCSQIIIEEFVEGFEITSPLARLFGEDIVLSPLKIKYKGLICDFETKNEIGGHRVKTCPKLSKHLFDKTKSITTEANRIIRSRFCSRVDFRIRKKIPYVLEINSEPALSKYDYLAKCAKLSGISYSQLIIGLLANSRKFISDAKKNNFKLYEFINKTKKEFDE